MTANCMVRSETGAGVLFDTADWMWMVSSFWRETVKSVLMLVLITVCVDG